MALGDNRTLTFTFIGKDKASPAMKQMGSSADRLKSKALAIGAALGGVYALGKVKEFVGGAIAAASDLNESQSKAQVVFGKSAKAVVNFASTAATALGQSKQQALEAAGTFGNLLVALKFSQPEAAKMSTRFVRLASDLASFNNTSPDEALLALRSGLTGETEPLKKFGVNLNETTLKQKAMAMGLVDTATGVLPASIKAQAAYALILEQTKTAQGDFARTSDGLANKQRIQAAKWDDLKAKIGAGLLPIQLKLTSFMSDRLIPALGATADFIGRNKDVIVPLVGVLGGAVVLFKTITLATQAWAAAQAILNGTLVLNPIGLVVVAVAALAAGIIVAYKRSETFRRIADGAFRVVGRAIGFVKDHWKAFAVAFITIATGGVGGAVLAIVLNFGKIKAAAIAVVDKVKDTFWGVVHFFGGLPGKIRSATAGMFDGIKDAFKSAVNWIIGGWNGLSFKLPEVDTHIPGVGKVGGWSLDTPDIHPLARGGIVRARRGGTHALIGEGGRDEAVVPLPRGASSLVGAGGGRTVVEFNVNVSGVTAGSESRVASEIVRLVRKYAREIGRDPLAALGT
jgi:hypothetical protein